MSSRSAHALRLQDLMHNRFAGVDFLRGTC